MKCEDMELYTLAKLFDNTGKNAKSIVRCLYAFEIKTYDDLRQADVITFPKRYGLSIGERRYEIIRKMQHAIRA